MVKPESYREYGHPMQMKMRKAKKTVMASSHPKIACFQPLSPLVSAVSFSGDELARGKFKVTPCRFAA